MKPAWLLTVMRAGLAMGLATSAVAQSADRPDGTGDPGDEIIVTAQKREQSLRDVPLAISAFGQQSLDDSGIRTTKDLTDLVPSLRIPNESPSSSGNGFVFMRGIGTDNTQYTLDPAVGIYIDGVYFARAYGTIFDLFDLERVEVLRGPQGTLYGRNNSAGAIRVITRAPNLDSTDFGARFAYGRLNEVRGEFSASAPIVEDRLGARLSVTHRQNDGFQTNTLNRNDRGQSINFTGINAQLLWRPAEAVDITLRYLDFRDRGDAVQSVPVGATDRRSFSTNLENVNRIGNRGISATVEADVGNVGLTSITARRRVDLDAAYDVDAIGRTEFEIPFQQIRSRYWTQELFLGGRLGESMPLEWVVGTFYYREKIGEQATVVFGPGVLAPPLPTITVRNDRSFRTESISVYGQGTLYVLPQLGLTAGMRWTDDRKRFADRGAGLSLRKFKDDNLTWRLAAEWKPAEPWLVFASATTGFRAGGFDINTGNPFPTEKVRTIEGGVRTSQFSNRLQLSGVYFHSRFDSLQQSVTDPNSPTGLATVFFDARAQGLELEASLRLFPGFTLAANAATLATKPFVDVPGAKDLKQSPKFSGRISGQYRVDAGDAGSLLFNIGYTRSSSYFLDPENTRLRQVPASGELDARIAFRTAEGRWEFAVDGRNLLDEDVPPFKFFFGFPGLTEKTTKFNRSPRTWLLSATMRY